MMWPGPPPPLDYKILTGLQVQVGAVLPKTTILGRDSSR